MDPLSFSFSRVIIGIMGCLMLVTCGCAASAKYGAVKINSTPQGAEVVNLKDETYLGTTPVKVMFSGDADTAEFVTVQLRKLGYIDRITSFWVNRRHPAPEDAELNAIDIQVELEKQ